MKNIFNFVMVALLLACAWLATDILPVLVIAIPAALMAGVCELDEGTERQCDVSGPGGVARLFALDRKYLTNAPLGANGIVSGLTLTGAKKFWELYIDPNFELTSMNSPSSAASGGAVFAQTAIQFHLQAVAPNMVWRDKFVNTTMTFVSVDKRGQWLIAGFGPAGISYEQTTQLGSGQVAADRPEMIITGIVNEHIRYGVRPLIYPIEAWDTLTTYALGDIVTKVILGVTHYYESLQAANTGNDPASATTYWLEVTQLQAEYKNTLTKFLTIVN